MAEQVVQFRLDYFDPEPKVPEPVLVQSEHVCYLIFNDRNGGRKAVWFEHCSVTKFGYPNDDALGGHPLYEKGLGFYGCYEVTESRWIEEFRLNNKVTFPDFELMANSRHFIFTFHDSTFECIADGVRPIEEFPQIDNLMMKVYGI